MIAVGDSRRRQRSPIRNHAETGRRTARLELGNRRPVTLVPAGDRL